MVLAVGVAKFEKLRCDVLAVLLTLWRRNILSGVLDVANVA